MADMTLSDANYRPFLILAPPAAALHARDHMEPTHAMPPIRPFRRVRGRCS